ncbi:5-deoxy-glucuronate isomerase [Alphaproteobacteria bacterium]|jgi:5-deoxy-glucuronate isomerase|nr:5-deoxy-glucuronate isomerase [Alphaproteobacteria bacterium]
MSTLLLKPNEGSCLHNITPASAGWNYVGFQVHRLSSGQILEDSGNAMELCIVLLSGNASFTAGGTDFGSIQGRSEVFSGTPPHALYVPHKTSWQVVAAGACEVAICQAPGVSGQHQARMITPQMMSFEVRGSGTNTRHVCNILPETEPADSLLVVEVITPSGNWSSYPPHKHDTDNLPEESYLEETYYHRINPESGYVLHRVYTDDRSLDEVMAAEDHDVVLVPKGYHPVGAPHGYESYYLNVMAGPKRIWKFKNDPAHEWMLD